MVVNKIKNLFSTKTHLNLMELQNYNFQKKKKTIKPEKILLQNLYHYTAILTIFFALIRPDSIKLKSW